MLEQRIKLGEGGRLVIPAILRKEIGVEPGDEMVIGLENGEIRLFSQAQALGRIRASLKKYKNKNSVDDFLKFRKKDSGT